MKDQGERNMSEQKRKVPDFKKRTDHYNTTDINDKLIINLRDLSHVIRFLYEGKGSQKRILILLNEMGIVTQRALTQRLGVQPGSASEVLAKLEGAGLIIRTPSGSDRRTADIQLTETGKVKAKEVSVQRKQRHEEMFSCLSREEKQVFLELMEKVYSDWETRYIEKDEDK